MNFHETVYSFLPSLKTSIENWQGDNLNSLLVFGSFANARAIQTSDLDLLLVVQENNYSSRQDLWKDWHRFIENPWESLFESTGYEPPPLSPIFLKKERVFQGSPLFWDMIESRINLKDNQGFFEGYLQKLEIQMKNQGSRKRWIGGSLVWELKPGARKGDSILI